MFSVARLSWENKQEEEEESEERGSMRSTLVRVEGWRGAKTMTLLEGSQ
jgi:hypothetical protein